MKIHAKANVENCENSSLKNVHSATSNQSLDQKYLCTFCGKDFLHKRYLKKHKKIHDKRKHEKCDKCGRKFVYEINLQKHKQKHENEVIKLTKCDICFKEFKYIDKYRTRNRGINRYKN